MADYDSAFVWLGLGGLPRLLRLLSAFLAALLCSLLQSRMNSFIFVEEIVLFHVDAAILVEMLLFLLVIVPISNGTAFRMRKLDRKGECMQKAHLCPSFFFFCSMKRSRKN